MDPRSTYEGLVEARDQEIRDLNEYVRKQLTDTACSFVGAPLTNHNLDIIKSQLEVIMSNVRRMCRYNVFDDIRIGVRVKDNTIYFNMEPLTVEAKQWLQEQINRGVWKP